MEKGILKFECFLFFYGFHVLGYFGQAGVLVGLGWFLVEIFRFRDFFIHNLDAGLVKCFKKGIIDKLNLFTEVRLCSFYYHL